VTKAGTRAIANTSPEPFSNWLLSLVEDVFVLGLGYVALQYPLVALAIVLALLVIIMAFAVVLFRAARRRFGRRPPDAPAANLAPGFSSPRRS
jgi:ABC-type xylose transport system permease subunit